MRGLKMSLVLLFVLSVPSPTGAQGEATASRGLEIWAALLSSPITSREEFMEYASLLRKNGFKADDENWTFDDPTGRLVISAFPDQGAVFVHYYPKTQTRIGDAALAALINRAESVRLMRGDSISLSLPDRRLSKEGKVGTASEELEFSLNGGTLLGTSVSIEWSK